MSEQILDRWAEELNDELVDGLAPETVAVVAREASSIAAGVVSAASTTTLTGTGIGLSGAATTAAGLSTAAKVAVATLAVAVGAGVAAATGSLPDAIQSWVAEVVEEVGIELPAPLDQPLPTLPLEIPNLDPPSGDQVPLPESPPGGSLEVIVPHLTVPGLELP